MRRLSERNERVRATPSRCGCFASGSARGSTSVKTAWVAEAAEGGAHGADRLLTAWALSKLFVIR